MAKATAARNRKAEKSLGRFAANKAGITEQMPANTNSANVPDGELIDNPRMINIALVHDNALADFGFIAASSGRKNMWE